MEKLNLHPTYLLACSLLLTACDGTDESTPDLDEVVEPDLGEVEAPAQQQVPVLGPVIDCPAGRMIGILHNPESSCSLRGAVPPGWTWKGMFAAGSPGVDALTIPVPTDLKRFCMYEYVNGLPKQEDYQAMVSAIHGSGIMSVDSVAADCRGEFAQGNGLNDYSLAVELHDAFRTNIDWVDAGVLGITQQKRTRVDVTVVDTVSQEAIDQGFHPVNEHGIYMAELIADIACPDGDPNCRENFRYALAMPRYDWASLPDWVEGGEHGTQGDVALAIYEAVGGWHERRLANPSKAAPRLVLNLSIGWQRLTQDTDALERGPAKSILSALQYASCQGALVFVAAGNNPDEGCPTDHPDPLAPASYEQFRAPTQQECLDLGFASPWAGQFPVHGSPSGYDPLVHAVGGVDEYDRPIINARIDGTPRLVALGSNGVVAQGGAAFEPLTGTSVSAAVASGIASLVWSYRPDLRPHELVELMYETGYKVDRDSEFGMTGWLMPQMRLSACAALAAACDGQDPDACPKLECEAEAPALDGNLTYFFKQTDSILDDPTTKVDELDTNASPGAPVCENFDFTNLADPQPPKPVCSRCSMSIAPGATVGDDSIKMTTDSMYDGMVTAAWVTVYDAVGTPTAIHFDGAVIASLNSPTADVTVTAVNAPTTVSATLNFTLADGSKQSNSIPVALP